MNSEIERMVTDLAGRIRNLEIWKAEQILLARDGELPSPNPLPGAGPEITSMVKAINENPMNAMCDKEGQTESPLKESDGLWHPSNDWKPKDSAPAEPAPGSDAEHPPVGYVLVPRFRGEKVEANWIIWAWGKGPWEPLDPPQIGEDMDKCKLHPCARPIPANEGDSRLAESVAIPAGWVASTGGKAYGGGWILPDPSIPWGEGYEAILPQPSQGWACDGDQGYLPKTETNSEGWYPYRHILPERILQIPWRRCIPATTPTEPARDLSAEGERLEAELRAANHRADIAENEEAYSLKRSGERMRVALEKIAAVDARNGSEYALICEMRKAAWEALK